MYLLSVKVYYDPVSFIFLPQSCKKPPGFQSAAVLAAASEARGRPLLMRRRKRCCAFSRSHLDMSERERGKKSKVLP